MPAAVGESIAFIRAALAADGYAYLPAFASDPTGRALLTCARALGALWPLPDTDAAHPLMETRPAADAPAHAPFDRPEALGWHNDFSTHPERPGVSLAYLDRPDPLGPERGAWRVASCDRVLEHLDATRDGREALRFLVDRELPFSVTPLATSVRALP